jgi:hypothetical protein
MTVNPPAGLRIAGVETTTVIRGRPPLNCSMGCPEFRSEDICGTCYRRPIKSIETIFTKIEG